MSNLISHFRCSYSELSHKTTMHPFLRSTFAPRRGPANARVRSSQLHGGEVPCNLFVLASSPASQSNEVFCQGAAGLSALARASRIFKPRGLVMFVGILALSQDLGVSA